MCVFVIVDGRNICCCCLLCLNERHVSNPNTQLIDERIPINHQTFEDKNVSKQTISDFPFF